MLHVILQCLAALGSYSSHACQDVQDCPEHPAIASFTVETLIVMLSNMVGLLGVCFLASNVISFLRARQTACNVVQSDQVPNVAIGSPSKLSPISAVPDGCFNVVPSHESAAPSDALQADEGQRDREEANATEWSTTALPGTIVRISNGEHAANDDIVSAVRIDEAPPRITTPMKMMGEDHLSYDSTASPHVTMVPRVCVRRLSGQLVLDEPLSSVTTLFRQRLGAVWRLKQIIANRVNVRPEKQDLVVGDRRLTDDDLVAFGPAAPLDVVLMESFDDDSTELTRRTEASTIYTTPSDLALDDYYQHVSFD